MPNDTLFNIITQVRYSDKMQKCENSTKSNASLIDNVPLHAFSCIIILNAVTSAYIRWIHMQYIFKYAACS